MTAYRKNQPAEKKIVLDYAHSQFVGKVYYHNQKAEEKPFVHYSRIMDTKIPRIEDLENLDITLNQWELKSLLTFFLNRLHKCRAIFFYQNVLRKNPSQKQSGEKDNVVMFKMFVNDKGNIVFSFRKSHSRQKGEPNKALIYNEDNADCIEWFKWLDDQNKWVDEGKAFAFLQKVIKEYQEVIHEEMLDFEM